MTTFLEIQNNCRLDTLFDVINLDKEWGHPPSPNSANFARDKEDEEFLDNLIEELRRDADPGVYAPFSHPLDRLSRNAAAEEPNHTLAFLGFEPTVHPNSVANASVNAGVNAVQDESKVACIEIDENESVFAHFDIEHLYLLKQFSVIVSSRIPCKVQLCYVYWKPVFATASKSKKKGRGRDNAKFELGVHSLYRAIHSGDISGKNKNRKKMRNPDVTIATNGVQTMPFFLDPAENGSTKIILGSVSDKMTCSKLSDEYYLEPYQRMTPDYALQKTHGLLFYVLITTNAGQSLHVLFVPIHGAVKSKPGKGVSAEDSRTQINILETPICSTEIPICETDCVHPLDYIATEGRKEERERENENESRMPAPFYPFSSYKVSPSDWPKPVYVHPDRQIHQTIQPLQLENEHSFKKQLEEKDNCIRRLQLKIGKYEDRHLGILAHLKGRVEDEKKIQAESRKIQERSLELTILREENRNLKEKASQLISFQEKNFKLNRILKTKIAIVRFYMDRKNSQGEKKRKVESEERSSKE